MCVASVNKVLVVVLLVVAVVVLLVVLAQSLQIELTFVIVTLIGNVVEVVNMNEFCEAINITIVT